MSRTWLKAVVVLVCLAASAIVSAASIDFADLKPNQQVADFRTESVYLNEAGSPVGARFRHIPSDFVLDVLRIQSVPQAFMWVNTPPVSDQGEPHTLEHLLLGKGTRGRYVASLEDMSLGSSSAFTRQLWTCYHYHTTAGKDVFFNLLEAKLDAMLHPNYSDEEIRREVANMGVSLDPADSSLRLEEKGTVYAEMVSSFERPWSTIGHEIGQLIYGAGHPASYNSGGLPSALRTMVPDDIRRFHGSTHSLNNMGMVMSIADDIALEDCLRSTGEVFKHVEPNVQKGSDPAEFLNRLPAPKPKPEGTVSVVGFPAQEASTPGIMMLGWPARYDLPLLDNVLLQIFLNNMAGSPSSNLYQRFIDSQRRRMDLGADNLYTWIDEGNGHPFYFAFTGVKPEMLSDSACQEVRRIVREEIAEIAALPDASADLAAFNERAASNLAAYRRSLREFLNSPPRFGYRGTGSSWMDHLALLQTKDGFQKRITLDDELAEIERLIASNSNFWKNYLTQWGLLQTSPYVVAAKADPALYARNADGLVQRISDFEKKLMSTYGVDSPKLAIARYDEEYNANTAVIDSAAATIAMPDFIDNPPMTLDEQLDYEVKQLPGGGPLVVSTFENMSGATAGFAMSLNVIPESLLVYVPALPSMLTDVGVVRDGRVIPYDELSTALQREIRSLDAYFSTNYRTERTELTVRASGTSLEESGKAVSWLETILFSADWRTENLPRLRDAVDLALKNSRNRMQDSEESWVDDPAYAFWKQNNPLILCASSFLTQGHALQRTKWLLSGDDDPTVATGFKAAMAKLGSAVDGRAREELLAYIDGILTESGDATVAEEIFPPSMDSRLKDLVFDAVRDLKSSLGEIPDATMVADWKYVCAQIASDFAVPPQTALAQLNEVNSLLRHQDNVRGFLIGSSESQTKLIPRLNSFVGRFDSAPSKQQSYSLTEVIVNRMRDRYPQLTKRPSYVGLVNRNSSSGVFINTSDCADYTNHDRHELASFLAARLYGGGGAHSMFMKTWGAGLAYSNGLRSSVDLGRIIYYAERCPDLSQTMQFVVDQLEKAPYDPSLGQYAVAQVFDASRAASRYEQRGEAIAADLADGVTPDVVRAYRKSILELRDQPGFYDTLYALMKPTYGEVLPGYGPPIHSFENAFSFTIGPDRQLDSYETYLKRYEGDVDLLRIYPRDYWITKAKL